MRALVLPDNCGLWQVAVFDSRGVWQSSQLGLTQETAQKRMRVINSKEKQKRRVP